MEIKRRVINHSKRWSKIRRQLPVQTTTLPPPTETPVPPAEEETDSGSEDDLEDSESEDELPPPPPQTTPSPKPTPTSTSSVVQTSESQTSSSQTGVLQRPVTVLTSTTTTLATSVVPASFSPTNTAISPAVLSEPSSSIPTMNIAAISVGSIIGVASLAAAIYFMLLLCRRRQRRRQLSQLGNPEGDGDEVRIVDHASPMPASQVPIPLPAPTNTTHKHFSIQSSSSAADSQTQIPSYNQAMAYNPLLHPVIPGNEESRDAKPVHFFREQVDPFIESPRTSQFMEIEGLVLEPGRQSPPFSPQSQPPPQVSPALPDYAHARGSPPAQEHVPESIPVPAPAHIHTLFPTQFPGYTVQTAATSPTISSIRHGSQPGAPPSTLSHLHSIFIPQNRESITPSESASNLPYDREGVRREVEKLQAMMTARTPAAGGRRVDSGDVDDRSTNRPGWI